MMEKFMDEVEAWNKVHNRVDEIILNLGRAADSCSISEYTNLHGDGGTYILMGKNSEPLLTAIIYRDTLNYTIMQLTENKEALEAQ